jgi:hypothetical protein
MSTKDLNLIIICVLLFLCNFNISEIFSCFNCFGSNSPTPVGGGGENNIISNLEELESDSDDNDGNNIEMGVIENTSQNEVDQTTNLNPNLPAQTENNNINEIISISESESESNDSISDLNNSDEFSDRISDPNILDQAEYNQGIFSNPNLPNLTEHNLGIRSPYHDLTLRNLTSSSNLN